MWFKTVIGALIAVIGFFLLFKFWPVGLIMLIIGSVILFFQNRKWETTHPEQAKRIRELQVSKSNHAPSKRQLEKTRVEKLKQEHIAYCPRCHSTSLSANARGFGIGKAVIGATLFHDPIGLVAGNIGAKRVRVTCLNCGKQFWAGKK